MNNKKSFPKESKPTKKDANKPLNFYEKLFFIEKFAVGQ